MRMLERLSGGTARHGNKPPGEATEVRMERSLGPVSPAKNNGAAGRNSPATRPRVLIADEHPATILGIRSTLEQGGFEICAEVATVRAALDAARRHVPDICLVDIALEDRGVDLAGRLSRTVPSSLVIMLSSSHDDDRFLDAILAGAAGYLLKDIAPEKLAAALQGALADGAVLPRSLTGRLIEELRERAMTRVLLGAHRGANLTRRETDVLRLLRQNLTTREIAKRLSISPVTVRTHLSAIARKCQAESRHAILKLLDDLESSA